MGLYDEKYKNCGLENYEYILRLVERGHKGYRVNKCLWNYRVLKKNMSIKRNKNNNYGQYLSKKYKLGGYKINKNIINHEKDYYK